jgi:hypothetical protein
MSIDGITFATVVGGGIMTFSQAARLMLIVLLAVAVTGCEIIGGIFKAGMAVGIISVVLVVALAFWLVAKAVG